MLTPETQTAVASYQQGFLTLWESLLAEGIATEPFPGFAGDLYESVPEETKALFPDQELLRAALACVPVGARLDIRRDEESWIGINGFDATVTGSGQEEADGYLSWPFIPLMWDIFGNALGLTRDEAGAIRLAATEPSPLYDPERPADDDDFSGWGILETSLAGLPAELGKLIRSGEEMSVVGFIP